MLHQIFIALSLSAFAVRIIITIEASNLIPSFALVSLSGTTGYNRYGHYVVISSA